jgi:hypothetical protein
LALRVPFPVRLGSYLGLLAAAIGPFQPAGGGTNGSSAAAASRMMLRFGPQYGRTTLSTLSTGSGISPPASNWSGFDSLGGMGVVLGINFVIAFSVNLYYAAVATAA